MSLGRLLNEVEEILLTIPEMYSKFLFRLLPLNFLVMPNC